VSYALANTMYDDRTNKLLELLRDDDELHEGLPEKPAILKGPPRFSPQVCQIYVYRERVNAPGYWMGLQGSDFVGQWIIACVVRHAGDPEQLEKYMSIMAANVMRNIIDNRQVASYWDVATPGPSTATRARGEKNQTWEIEAIPVILQWQDTHA